MPPKPPNLANYSDFDDRPLQPVTVCHLRPSCDAVGCSIARIAGSRRGAGRFLGDGQQSRVSSSNNACGEHAQDKHEHQRQDQGCLDQRLTSSGAQRFRA